MAVNSDEKAVRIVGMIGTAIRSRLGISRAEGAKVDDVRRYLALAGAWCLTGSLVVTGAFTGTPVITGTLEPGTAPAVWAK